MQAQIVAQDEISRFNLVSNCLAWNTQTNIIYVLVSSSSIDQLKHLSTIFIVPIRVNNGQLLNKINIDISSNIQINAYFPILIGNEALYVSWLMGSYSDIVSLNVTTVPQIQF